MISLKRSLDEVERNVRRFESALKSLLALVESIDEHTLLIHPELEREYHERLRAIHQRVAEQPDEEVLGEARRALNHALQEHARRAAEIFHSKTEEIRQILLVLAHATDTVQARSGSFGDRFRKIAGRLETVARLDDLDQIRKRLSEHIGELNQGVETMRHDTREMVDRMRAEMDGIQKRLDQAERLAELDVVTGLVNRRGMERRLGAAVAAGDPFSIILFDLNRFKGINDRHGHLCGDEVLRHFSRRLETQFRPTDAICRWGGDEFLALLPCEVKDAMARGRLIAQTICGPYAIRLADRELRVEISVSFGVAEYRPGQSLDDILALADSLMYQSKDQPG